MRQPGSALEPEGRLVELTKKALSGGEPKYHEQNLNRGKLFVRERIRLMLDADSDFVEDGLLARCEDDGLLTDAVVTGYGLVHGRTVCIIANDSTIKAGTWGRTTIKKIIRMQDAARRMKAPLIYMQDSAGARLDEQFDLFADRSHAGRIFYNQIELSGVVPQVCILFGPSPAGAAYLPAFCDFVIMVEGNATAYIGSPRMAEMVIGEKVNMEQMGGARMHCTQSGLGDCMVQNESEALSTARRYLSYLPSHWSESPPLTTGHPPKMAQSSIEELVPSDHNTPYDMYLLIDYLVDSESFFEIKALFARELITGLARLNGFVVGIVANQPKVKGGVLFPDSADKGAYFVQLCNAFNIPLLFLQDISGFMLGSAVERQGIIRHGAKMLSAVAQATVPRISVLVRKAYGAGYMAMSGASFQADATIALPTARIGIMGPESAINAMYYNKIMEMSESERSEFVEAKRAEYEQNLTVYRAASEFFIDAVVPGTALRQELIARFRAYRYKSRTTIERWNGIIRG